MMSPRVARVAMNVYLRYAMELLMQRCEERVAGGRITSFSARREFADAIPRSVHGEICSRPLRLMPVDSTRCRLLAARTGAPLVRGKGDVLPPTSLENTT